VRQEEGAGDAEGDAAGGAAVGDLGLGVIEIPTDEGLDGRSIVVVVDVFAVFELAGGVVVRPPLSRRACALSIAWSAPLLGLLAHYREQRLLMLRQQAHLAPALPAGYSDVLLK
jgi:hypothetical protein